MRPERRIGPCGDATRAPTQGPKTEGGTGKLSRHNPFFNLPRDWHNRDKSRGASGTKSLKKYLTIADSISFHTPNTSKPTPRVQ